MKKTMCILKGLAVAIILVAFCGCGAKSASEVGTLIDALDNSAWEASKWISVVDAPIISDYNIERAADGANWFVSTVKNEQRVTSAKWMTTGLGVFQLWLNGQPVGKEVLKPGFTNPFKTKISFTYDITDAFCCNAGAENVLSAQVTPGWWGDRIVTPGGNKGMYGTKCAFRGVLELTFADGSKKLYGTDLENWKAGIAGPVKHAAIFDGEEYDAREKMGFECMETLSVPEENKEFHGRIFPTKGAEVYMRHDLMLSPVKAYLWSGVEGKKENEYGKVIVTKEFTPGEPMVIKHGETLVVDFGQNCAAVPSFEFKGKAGTVLTCLPGEILNDGNGARSRGMDGPEGSVHRENLRAHENCFRLLYTFADTKGFVKYYPRCTFFGYRFVSITATDEVTIKSIASIPVTSIAKELEIGKISTGNNLVNKLISNTYWGQLSNYLSVPTDCPQRNERLGWTADTQVFSETGSFFANTANFFHKWMRDMRDSQNNLGGFPGVAPLAQYGGEYMRFVQLANNGAVAPSDKIKLQKEFKIGVKVTVNRADLRKYLEEHGIIKSMNSIF